MKDRDLTKLLGELARRDLSEGSNIEDHPCSIAVQRIKELQSFGKLIGKKYKIAISALRRITDEGLINDSVDWFWLAHETLVTQLGERWLCSPHPSRVKTPDPIGG